MSDNEEILMRVLFELSIYDIDRLSDSIEGAAMRAELEEAGGMPTLKEDMSAIRLIVLSRYSTARDEIKRGEHGPTNQQGV